MHPEFLEYNRYSSQCQCKIDELYLHHITHLIQIFNHVPNVDCIGSLSTPLVYPSLKEHILTLFKSSSAAPPKPIFEHRSLEPGLNNPARCRVVVLWCCGAGAAVVGGASIWKADSGAVAGLRWTAVDCGGLLTNSRPQSRMGRDSVNTWAQCYIYSYCYIYGYLL